MRFLLSGLTLFALLVSGCGGTNTPGMGQGSNMDNMTAQFGQKTTDATSTAPSALWDVKTLKSAPKVELISQSTEKSASGDIVVKELKYDCPSAGGERLGVFAYYAYPANKSNHKLPSIVWVHGGAHRADKAATIEWASRGYAAISMDLPGKGGPWREASQSDGPDMTDDNTFKVSPSPKNSWLYPAVNSVCRAISVMANQDQVDPLRIGVIGYSWGGVITLIVNGIDDRVATACCVFGAGFIPDESHWAESYLKKMPPHAAADWRKYFDPASYMNTQHAKTLFVGATQDTYYPLRSLVRTFKSASCEKCLAISLNKNHELDDACSHDIVRWFDWALRSGSSFPALHVAKNGSLMKLTAKGSRPIIGAAMVTADSSDTTKAKWTSTNLNHEAGAWIAKPPAPNIPYFFTVQDDNGTLVASEVYFPVNKH